MTKFLEKAQWISGEAVADFLDTFFRGRGWHITRTTQHEERDLYLGDRHYRKGNAEYLVEYKSGIQTFYTGNVFLETISVDSQHKQGWVYTCKADFIFYAALRNGKILVLVPAKLRAEIDGLRAKFREVATSKNQNEGYNTHGVIIPLAYVEDYLTEQIIMIAPSVRR